jgi:hypothetical protein
MNEKLKEIVKQAGVFYSYQDQVWELTNGDLERFAELIVRECVKSTIALQNTAIDNEWHLDETFHIIVDDMVEQFDMQHIFRS